MLDSLQLRKLVPLTHIIEQPSAGRSTDSWTHVILRVNSRRHTRWAARARRSSRPGSLEYSLAIPRAITDALSKVSSGEELYARLQKIRTADCLQAQLHPNQYLCQGCVLIVMKACLSD
jgi:hypothetical protein